MTKNSFLAFYPDAQHTASVCYDAVSIALSEFGINSPLTLIGALATVRTEVGREFIPIEEIASGAAYEFRKDLGNYCPGDGPKYKGRGYIQLTGRKNYESYGKAIGVDLVCHPELALDVTNAAKILTIYFKDKGIPLSCNGQSWNTVRYLVNGGYNGLTTFRSVINQYLKA